MIYEGNVQRSNTCAARPYNKIRKDDDDLRKLLVRWAIPLGYTMESFWIHEDWGIVTLFDRHSKENLLDLEDLHELALGHLFF